MKTRVAAFLGSARRIVTRVDLELRDIFALAAVVCIGAGLYMVYPPAGWIGVGVLALAAAVVWTPPKKGE